MENQQSDSTNLSFCTGCGAKLPTNITVNFCGMCGAAVNPAFAGVAAKQPSRGSLSVRQWTAVTLIALGIFIPSVLFTGWKTGPVPTDTIVPAAKSSAEEPFEIPAKFRPVQDAASKAPNDLKLQNEYAAVLVSLIREKEEPPQALVLEAVEQLSRILALNPLEPDAILSLADISFNQQIFSKAAELYQRFLALRPNDLEVRTRYGSALMFQGEFDRSIEQQNQVLKTDPKNFQATAYLAIATGQKGDIASARKIAERAIAVAPNEEAKTKLQAFIASLDKRPAASMMTPSEQNPRPETGAVVPNASTQRSSSAFEQALLNNPVAGRKVEAITIKGSVATARMNNFPMAAMPPYAKDKFYSSLVDAAGQSGVKTVVFVDAASGAELERKEF